MNSLPNLYIISNDKFYNNKYSNHNDLGTIINSFIKYYNVNIIARKTRFQFKFPTIINKIKFLNFFSIKTIKNINTNNKKDKFLFISLTPFNIVVFLLLKFILKKNYFYLYLRSNGFNEYKIILGNFGKLFYFLMFKIIIDYVKLIVSSKDLSISKKYFHSVKPSELTKIWFKNRTLVNINNDVVKFVYLGRIRKEKGIIDFIKLINSSDINYQLEVYGLDYSNHNKNINYSSRSKNIKRIKYFPQIYNIKKIIDVYDKCNIFILPSYTESAPKVIWESLSRLRPVIVFKDIRHVAYKKKGVYVCERNVTSLSRKINFIKKNYKNIQKKIKKNKFPTKNEFQNNLLNIIKKDEYSPKKI
jgi:glycosyltransferase involved in cell wall biosynthesis